MNELNSVASSDSAAQYSGSAMKVLRQTYALLSMTILWSMAVMGAMVSIDISEKVASMGWVSLVVGLVALFGVLFIAIKKSESPSALFWVFTFTGMMGVLISISLDVYLSISPDAVLLAAISTVGIFTGLSMYTYKSGKDFSFLGGFLFAALLTLIIVSLINTFFIHAPIMSLAISFVAVAIFSLYILKDTSDILHGHETSYVRATIGLYLDVMNLFMNLLHIISAFSGLGSDD